MPYESYFVARPLLDSLTPKPSIKACVPNFFISYPDFNNLKQGATARGLRQILQSYLVLNQSPLLSFD